MKKAADVIGDRCDDDAEQDARAVVDSQEQGGEGPEATRSRSRRAT